MNGSTIDSEQLRTILERTLFAAEQRGMVNQSDGGWQYQEGALTLQYSPATDELRFYHLESSQSFCWRGHQLIESTVLNSQQIAEFYDLDNWLNQIEMPSVVDLREQSFSLPAPADVSTLKQTAEQLFEYYAAQGEPAFRLSAERSIDYYSIELSGINYFLSRDEAAGSYNIQRENTELSLNQPQTITRQDLEVWSEVENWLTFRPTVQEGITDSGPTYWDLHQSQLSEILPIAQRFLSFQEALGETWIAPGERYSTSVAQYEIGYSLEDDQIHVQREGIDLHTVGTITQADTDFFQSLARWLDQREAASGFPTISSSSSPSRVEDRDDDLDL